MKGCQNLINFGPLKIILDSNAVEIH